MSEGDYVRESLAWGFFCPHCHCWNGDEKEFRETCRACEAPRPRVKRRAGSDATGKDVRVSQDTREKEEPT